MDIRQITIDVVRSYAQACFELHGYIEESRQEGFDLLVVPSRGAHPFIEGASSYAHHLRSQQYEDFDPAAPGIKRIEEMYLPFTADIADDFEVSSVAIRRYWSRVLWAILNGKREDIALRFYEQLRSIAGDLSIGSTRVRGGKSGRFIFVDTVVSGRAITEIISSFDNYGLTGCKYFLLVDQQGQRLRAEYRRKLDELSATGQVTLIYVDSIFTEDQGPAMSGIWTVTFPDLMVAAQVMIPDLAKDSAVGAGLYYVEISRRPDGSNRAITVSNGILHTLLYTAVRGADDSATRFLLDFQSHVREYKLQDPKATKRVADPLILRNIAASNTDISGSHVVRAYLDPRMTEKFINSLK